MDLLYHRTHNMESHSTCRALQCKVRLRVFLSKVRDLNIQITDLLNNNSSTHINSKFSKFSNCTLKTNEDPQCHRLSLNRKDHNHVLNRLLPSLNNSNFPNSSHNIKSKKSHSLHSNCSSL